jgi:hypothetical protein
MLCRSVASPAYCLTPLPPLLDEKTIIQERGRRILLSSQITDVRTKFALIPDH